VKALMENVIASVTNEVTVYRISSKRLLILDQLAASIVTFRSSIYLIKKFI